MKHYNNFDKQTRFKYQQYDKRIIEIVLEILFKLLCYYENNIERRKQ